MRQPPVESRLYAAPDGVMYCTTESDPQTGKARWRELKVAAVYEGRPVDDWDQARDQLADRAEALAHEPCGPGWCGGCGRRNQRGQLLPPIRPAT